MINTLEFGFLFFNNAGSRFGQFRGRRIACLAIASALCSVYYNNERRSILLLKQQYQMIR
jgi:hypothetical protein